MSITATEKVNMSLGSNILSYLQTVPILFLSFSLLLDDIIKLNKKEAPKAKGKPNKGPAAKKTVNAGS